MNLPPAYEQIQQNFTSNSRGTRMGKRIARNIAEFAPQLQPPIVCVGCGDGLEVEYLLNHLNIPIQENAVSKKVIGLEVTKSRVAIAQAANLPVYEAAAENIVDIVPENAKRNVYTAHCLEHCFNRDAVIAAFKQIALDTIIIIVPIELRGRTRNRAHFAPVANLGYLANCFGMDWTITMQFRWNIELEGVLVLKRKPMNWPLKYKGSRNTEFLIKGQF
jgi:hypothetical protein